MNKRVDEEEERVCEVDRGRKKSLPIYCTYNTALRLFIIYILYITPTTREPGSIKLQYLF